MSDQLAVTVTEAARRLSCSRAFTYRLVRAGELPSVRIRGARRILMSDLEEFLRQLRDEETARQAEVSQ